MNSKKSLIIIIIATLLGGIFYLTFNPSEIIKKPSRDKNYFELFKTSAEHGNTVVPYHVGLMYYHGDGTTQNYQKAFEWVKKSAEQGNAQAQHNLGFMYYHGKGTSKNYQKAFELFKKLAEQGEADAQYSLGLMYYHGKGTPKNMKKAFKWYKQAAEQGNTKAQYNLGATYYFGEGTTKNYQKAYTHFLIYDYLEKEKHTANEYLNKLEQKLTPQAIEYAQNEAEKMIQNFKRTYDDK
ncbi:hypothetical protein CL647_06915 [bacterium]|nr:hypothetical protein [bacterium]|tara:strand:+ start:28818 stop:29531 length:714 start_codon:yes stop_codon:yes gene_type:complete